MTAALEGSEGSAARPGCTLPPGKSRYPFYRRLGGPQGRSGRAENVVPTGIRSRTVQPVVSRYTDWATHITYIYIYIYIYLYASNKYISTLLRTKSRKLCSEIILYFFLKLWIAEKHKMEEIKLLHLVCSTWSEGNWNMITCDAWLLRSLWLLATTLESVASETSRLASKFLEQLLFGKRKWRIWILPQHML